MWFLRGKLQKLKVIDNISWHIIDEEGQKQQSKENKPPMLVVECYDINTYRFVKDISLYKNEDQVPFVKNSNLIDFLKESSFATNGQVIIIQTAKRVYFFDVKTGVQVQKTNTSDFGINHDECRMIYDF